MTGQGKTHLKVGDTVPNFVGVDQDGNEISAAGLAGKPYVLFFYPRDNTPGCTQEACNLRDNYSDLQKAGYAVIGISNDTGKKHQNFINKHSLPFPLIADTELEMLKLFGIWGPKKFMGKTFDGTHRTTFVVDANGIISKIIEKVKVADHAAQILES